MSPLSLWLLSVGRSFVIEGIIKVQPLAHVEDEVLCGLGWDGLDLIKYQYLTSDPIYKQRSRIQMYYEFGIFSTYYGGKEMPSWINCRINGSSIAFTIPSFPSKLRGLNICCLLENLSYLNAGYELPMIVVINITTNRTWIYDHFISYARIAEESVIFLSHWMFMNNEVEDGDELNIYIASRHHEGENVCSTRECGVGLVYDNGRLEEDALGYYKSWNHIIGGDLSAFQTTTGEYILYYKFFMSNIKFEIFPYYYPFIAESACSKGEKIKFIAFSQQKSDLVVHPRTQSRRVIVKMMESLRTKIAIVEFMYNVFKYMKIKTRSHLCFSLKLYTHSRFFHVFYILLVISSYN